MRLPVMRITSWRTARSRTLSPASVAEPRLNQPSVELTEDTKIPNAATIKIVKQDHTLGNMLRAYAPPLPSSRRWLADGHSYHTASS